MRSFFQIWICLCGIILPINGQDEKTSTIHIAEIDGRSWLVDPEGKPFFAHGITHIGSVKHEIEYEEVAKACKTLGFNAYGYGCPTELKGDMPYLEGSNHLVPISTYRSDGSFRFIDVFDPVEQERLAAKIKLACSRNRNNPNLIGYCWTDLAAWPLENSTGKNWVDFIRSLPDESHGKKAYTEFLEQWKGGEDPAARDLAFLRVIARTYFQTLGEANRKYDPHHLIFGDRFSFPTLVPEVLEEMLPYVDAIAVQPPYQPKFPKKKYAEIHQLTGKPILICDFAIRFKDGEKPVRGWKPQESAKLAGQSYAAYIREALATPYLIGAFWCNLADSKPGFKKKGVKQGLFDTGLTPRPELNQVIRELNQFREEITPEK